MKVALGGSFEALHIGHQHLINEAVAIGDNIIVGVTSDNLVSGKKLYKISKYLNRKMYVVKALSSRNAVHSIVKLKNIYGPTIRDRDIKVLIVTSETYNNAKKINRMRRERGLPPLILYVAGYIRGEYNFPICSTFIKLGIIDAWGRVI